MTNETTATATAAPKHTTGRVNWLGHNHTHRPNVSQRERCSQCFGARRIFTLRRDSDGRLLRDIDGKIEKEYCPTCQYDN